MPSKFSALKLFYNIFGILKKPHTFRMISKEKRYHVFEDLRRSDLDSLSFIPYKILWSRAKSWHFISYE